MKGVEAIKTKKKLDEICHIHGHLINLRVVKLLNVFQHALVFTCNEVDGNSLTTKSTSTTNPEKQVHPGVTHGI